MHEKHLLIDETRIKRYEQLIKSFKTKIKSLGLEEQSIEILNDLGKKVKEYFKWTEAYTPTYERYDEKISHLSEKGGDYIERWAMYNNLFSKIK